MGREKEDFERVLEECLNNFMINDNSIIYLEKEPTTRHEAWLLATSLATLSLLKEVKGLREDINKFIKKGK